MASDQACALGAAIFGAVAAGIYPDTLAAQKVMASKAEKSYQPDAAAAKAYALSYQRYLRLARFVEGETKFMKEGR
jgi:L-ribulokinase